MKISVKVLSGLLILAIIIAGCAKHQGAGAVSPPVTPPPDSSTGPVGSPDVAFYLTKADGSVLFKPQNQRLMFGNTGSGGLTILVDSTKTYQTIDGFGYAFTGGSAYLINRMPTTDRDALLKELFLTDSNRIGVSYLRVSIGASDLSANVFSYDDAGSPAAPDTNLAQFDLSADRYDLIPVLKQILALAPGIKILGSPWSAPLWMKSNNNSVGGTLLPGYYDVYARYFVRYIQAMKAEGIPIDAVTPQNEPMNPLNNPSMTLTAEQEADFVKNHLGPAFQAAGITTKIIAFDHNCENPGYPLAVLGDADARNFLDGSAFHLYGGDISALTQVHNAYPSKNVYFTEQWVGGPSHFGGDLGWHVKNLIIGAPRNWSRNVLEWNLANDPDYQPHTQGGCGNCLGALTIGASVSRNVSYYIIAHASKFVRPGSVRVDSNIPGSLQNVAFVTPDGKKVLIVLNDSGGQQAFNIQFKGKIVQVSLDGGAVGTFVW
ncbi:MAG: glucosylceramidase [Chitinophagaceae bacterium]|nr:glucosylceramidase [Chitinophagaceae bacterium]